MKSIQSLNKDIETLGIISIKTSDNLSFKYIKDVISAIKSINLNFTDIARKMDQYRNNPKK